MSNGKGSKARPCRVARDVFDARWEQTFGAPDKDVRLHREHCDCPPCTRIDALEPTFVLESVPVGRHARVMRLVARCRCGSSVRVSDGAGPRCFVCGMPA